MNNAKICRNVCLAGQMKEAICKSRCVKNHGLSCKAEDSIVLECHGVGLNHFEEIGQRQDAIIFYKCLQKPKH